MGISHAYGTPSTEKEATELIEKAIDLGCTFFDTAEVYGTADNPHHNAVLALTLKVKQSINPLFQTQNQK